LECMVAVLERCFLLHYELRKAFFRDNSECFHNTSLCFRLTSRCFSIYSDIQIMKVEGIRKCHNGI
jgi:hypothetical protein